MANPLSMLNVLNGTETSQPLLLGAGTTIAGQTFDGANRFVTVLAATTTLTLTVPLHANKIVLLASNAGLIITPPAATGTGNIYTILVVTAIGGGSVTIDAKAGAAADVFGGSVSGGTSGTGAAAWPTATNSNLITWNATTTGGLVGTCVQMIDVKTNLWWVSGTIVSSSTAATPFSNH